MSEAASGPFRRGMTMRRGLTLVLAVQGVIAVFLVLSDMEADWFTGFWSSDDFPAGPVLPGDQVRRYDPSEVRPRYTGPAPGPDVHLPADMPPRLEFSVHDAGDAGEFLLLFGAVEPGDAQRFEAHLASLDELSMPVALNSPGGVVDEALAIGRMLRDEGATTAVLPGMVCLSSCPYILAAGTLRLVSRTGAVGLHQHYYETPRMLPAFVAVEDIQRGQGRTMEYLIEMGVDPGVMVHSLNTPPDEIYVLVEEELMGGSLATEMVD